MARSKQYGTTWWGNKWLAALTNIDYANRIPRGRSYASKGMVQDVKVLPEKGRIEARVKGSYNPYYKVVLKFEQIPQELKDAFIKDLVKDMNILSKLTNRELDPSLLELAQKHHIKLFPSSWRDLDMVCDCPDLAVPCKHIAAVIYVASAMIDANPFYVFSLKGLDIIKEVEHLGFDIGESNKVESSAFSVVYKESSISFDQMCAMAQDFGMPLDIVTVERTVPIAWQPEFSEDSCYNAHNILDVNQAADQYRHKKSLDEENASADEVKSKSGGKTAAEVEAQSDSQSKTNDQVEQKANNESKSKSECKAKNAPKAKSKPKAKSDIKAQTQSSQGDTGSQTGAESLQQVVWEIMQADKEQAQVKKKPGRRSKAAIAEQEQNDAWLSKFGSVTVGKIFTNLSEHSDVQLFGQDEKFELVTLPKPTEIEDLKVLSQASSKDLSEAKALATKARTAIKKSQSKRSTSRSEASNTALKATGRKAAKKK